MTDIEFNWNRAKAAANIKKHRVSFEEAQAVFFDDFARHMPDPEHSHREDRYLLLGLSGRARLLVVSHCFREGGSVVRIISARKATPRERDYYRDTL